MNLLLLAKQVKESHFFPKKLSEVAAAASSAVLNLRGTLASLSCWAMAGITGFLFCVICPRVGIGDVKCLWDSGRLLRKMLNCCLFPVSGDLEE